MAEESDLQEKTEQPSAKRLREAKEKGQVARSKDLNAALMLIGASAAFLLFGAYMGQHLLQMMQHALQFDANELVNFNVTIGRLLRYICHGLLSVLPLMLCILLLTLLAPTLLGGWAFSTESFQPQFSRLSLLKGFKKMFSLNGLTEMGKAFLKFVLISVVTVLILRWQVPSLMALIEQPLPHAIANGLSHVGWSFLIISSSLLLIAAIDVPWQLHVHNKRLKMSIQEVKDEYKETEGKPEVKSQIRRTQQEIAQRRMMSEVPKADVILTNPTHFAVAIRYNQQGKRAPVVIAKGKDLIALQIARVAKANKVPHLTAPPLTRALYFSTDINAEVPRGLYVAVAQVLAYIYQLKDKDHYDNQPDFLNNLPIPDELKRNAEEER